MALIAALSLMIGVIGLIGSTSMISDGLGFTHIGTATSGPSVGNTSDPPPDARSMAARITVFGGLRLALSMLLVVGAVGTLGVRPSGRKASLAYAVGWIVMGGIEPLALRYRFGWPVVASAAYPFLLLALFNSPAWRAAFAPSPPASEAQVR
jgi:hypothetical protein